MFKPIEPLEVPVVDALTGLQVALPRLNRKGERVYKSRIYKVSPMRLWPDVKVIILDWESAFKAIEKRVIGEVADAKSHNTKPPNFNLRQQELTLEAIQRPINFDGVDYIGCFGWGSAVKHLQTLGLSIDVGGEAGLLECAEDGSRYLRAFLPSSLYGGGWLESARVLVLPDRTKFKGRLLADGFGLIKRSLAEALHNPESHMIRLGRGRQSYIGWGRYSWDRIKDEAIKLIKANLEKIGSPNWVLQRLDANAGGYKKRLLEIEPDMEHHPYLKLSANISVKKMMQEIAVTVPLETHVRIAVPSTSTVVWGGDPMVICSRHPMDSWQSQVALQVNEFADGYQEELEWIQSMTLYQTTETSPTTHAKGLRAVMDDEIMGDYDLVITEEDFKMLAGVQIDDYRDGMEKVMVIKDLVISFTQGYEPGCAFGIDPELWKSQGGDYDGDMGFLSPCSDYLSIWNACREWLGRDKSWKIIKSRSDPAARPEMLMEVFGNNVGFATNVVSTTFTRQPDNREGIAMAMYNAGVTLRSSVAGLDMWCNKMIKKMTDGFKSIVNMPAEKAMLRKAQQVISVECGGTASWAVWTQDSSPAFTNGIPMFYDQLAPETLKWLAEDRDNRRQPAYRMHIPPQQYTATCAYIYRETQEWILNEYSKIAVASDDGERYSFLQLIEIWPGSKFIGWAPHVTDEGILAGLEMVEEFAMQSVQVTWNSSEDTISFKETWQMDCERWAAARFSSRQEAVYALWRASHHASISGNGAAAVFMGFPMEAMSIVEEKPGLIEQAEEGLVSLVVGVQFNFIQGTAPESFGPVTLTVFELPWRGVLRLCLVADELLPGMKTQKHFPSGMLGMTAEELRDGGRFYTQPQPGPYVARFLRNSSGKSYKAYLTPLDATADLPDGVTLS